MPCQEEILLHRNSVSYCHRWNHPARTRRSKSPDHKTSQFLNKAPFCPETSSAIPMCWQLKFTCSSTANEKQSLQLALHQFLSLSLPIPSGMAHTSTPTCCIPFGRWATSSPHHTHLTTSTASLGSTTRKINNPALAAQDQISWTCLTGPGKCSTNYWEVASELSK